MDRAGEKRVLVVQLARFGDFLQTTPLLAALKAQHPGARLEVLVDRPRAELARLTPGVDGVRTVDLARLTGLAAGQEAVSAKLAGFDRHLKKLAATPYHLVVNVNTSWTAALIAGLVPAQRRRGPLVRPDRAGLTHEPWALLVMHLMRARRLIRFNLVDLLLGYAEKPTRPALGLLSPLTDQGRRKARALLSPAGPERLVGFQLGSRHFARRWPLEHFAALGRDLVLGEPGARLALVGMAGEKPLARQFMAAFERLAPGRGDRVLDLMGATDIQSLAGVLDCLDLLVTTDTGSMHLAQAQSAPILALFMGPAYCHETGPWGAGHLLLQAEPGCGPCTEVQAAACERENFCRQLITPTLALAAARHMLGLGPAPGPVGQVGIHRTELDGWGTVCRRLGPPAGYAPEVLAHAYREAGRALITPGWRLEPETLKKELCLLGPDPAPQLAAWQEALVFMEKRLRAGRVRDLAPRLRLIQARHPELGPLVLTAFMSGLTLDQALLLAGRARRVVELGQRLAGRKTRPLAAAGGNR